MNARRSEERRHERGGDTIAAESMTLARRWAGTGLVALVTLAVACSKPVPAGEAEAAVTTAVQAWRDKHEADYRREWVTIAGLHFLRPGAQTAGSAKTNDIELPARVPATLGRFVLEGTAVRFEPAPGVLVDLDGARVTAPVVLKDDSTPKADELKVNQVVVAVHVSGDRRSLRVWDPEGPLARGFKGFTWFPIQNDYRVTGRFIPDAQPRSLQVVNTFGIEKRPLMADRVLDTWPRNGSGRLDLKLSPMRLLAIVNRVDLRGNLVYGGGDAGGVACGQSGDQASDRTGAGRARRRLDGAAAGAGWQR